MALRQRLLLDIAELKRVPYPNIEFVPHEDVTKACVILTSNGTGPLHLTVQLPHDYPLRPPRITIQTDVVHSNVFGEYICASILNTTEGYTPAYDLKGICIQMLSFFASDKLEQQYGGSVDLTEYRALNNDASDIDQSPPDSTTSESTSTAAGASIIELPDELLLLVCNQLEGEDLELFSRAWTRIGGASGIVSRFNVVRNRELICFCLKKGLENANLGVGVKVQMRGRYGSIGSEFDLLSEQAFNEFKIRRSVQGLPFTHWLPLPISRKHYGKVKPLIEPCLKELSEAAKFRAFVPLDVVYCFMNDIVVRLSSQAEAGYVHSSLIHASEKAIESYFHLFHLLLCLAVEDRGRVIAANRTIKNFLVEGKTSKAHVPNLGYLLIACLIADVDVTGDLLKAIIRETVTRNVVWMLDKQGANMSELAYMEANTISRYRLQKTFDASKTSYRLLMFLNLFRRTINRGTGQNRKSLMQLREELFEAHGAPPKGVAERFAGGVRALQKVENFPGFLTVMGLAPPCASQFTAFLRNCVEESMTRKYSVWGISQAKALTLRQQVDHDVVVRKGHKPEWTSAGSMPVTFFPNSSGYSGGTKGRDGRS
ncbi:hypothetical protein LTS08_000878 [Lithohypha guttulata]|uniref:uncharacterized protein n=1 Tax=Lithohypha guttulata TaxID=1690604 RepID=UPI002DE12BF7|nr:hypothetical protein LTR51_006507 [Lithohypha guttulata]KAK5106756.1 hypothetical protein LTS08_000878 [Lithohypha guttulata]